MRQFDARWPCKRAPRHLRRIAMRSTPPARLAARRSTKPVEPMSKRTIEAYTCGLAAAPEPAAPRFEPSFSSFLHSYAIGLT